MRDIDMENHLVVVNTGAYTGNFERHMCAYITGISDDIWYGAGVRKKFNQSNKLLEWWEDNLLDVPYTRDEYVDQRKVAIRYSTEFRMHSSVEFLVETAPSEEQLLEIQRRAEDFCKNFVQIIKDNGENTCHRGDDIPFVSVQLLKAE
jgi:hypothetical protein